MKVLALQDQVGRGEYQVDELAVAAAIVRRMLGERGLRTTDKGSSSV